MSQPNMRFWVLHAASPWRSFLTDVGSLRCAGSVASTGRRIWSMEVSAWRISRDLQALGLRGEQKIIDIDVGLGQWAVP